FEFAADDDFLLGDAVVTEPHSFDVRVAARYQGRVYEWTYESHEGRVTMAATMAAEMELGTRVAGMETLHQRQLLYGNLSPDPNQISHITARFPGLIESVFPQLGDNVERGDLILSVEANDSLQSYEVRAPISGTVVDIHANPGEYAGTQSLMTIANYRNVWADLSVFPSDARRIRAGQMVELQLGDTVLQSSIRYLNPGEGNSPHVIARVPVPNPDLFWTPGLLVEAFVTIDEFEVPLAVDNRALQSFRDWQVVFIKIGNDYEIRPLELGRSDGRYTEVMDGLEPGATYVVENSYLLKADLEKSGAAHPH
ncbi:MAG: efflux RND transporter periplasmic adaptor subunit, partial [Gammaproteobacteria bacterium]